MGSELVKPHHLRRRAVIYVRPSTPHQVLTNQENLRLQYALQLCCPPGGRACLRYALASGDRPALKLAPTRPSAAPRQLSMVRDSVRLGGMSPSKRRAVVARLAAAWKAPVSRYGSTIMTSGDASPAARR